MLKVINHNYYGYRILMYMVLCLFFLLSPSRLLAQSKDKAKSEKQDKVFIDHADIITYNYYEKPNVQIAKGNVRFRNKTVTLKCDSAYINNVENYFYAFGNVHVQRNDGLNITCQRAYYEGAAQVVRTRGKVQIKQPGKTLKCDSLDYMISSGLANFFGGRGTMVYNGNTIISDTGDYNTNTHDANFYGDVIIRTPKYTINTPTAHGNTDTGIMNVIGKSIIKTAKGETVNTNDGTYNSKTDEMTLRGYSTIKSKDRDVEGDNINYNSSTGDARGQGNVKIYDKINNRSISGDDIIYNSKTGHTEGNGKVKIVDHKEKRTITGNSVIHNFISGHSEGKGNVVVIDEKQKRIISGEELRYNDKTHVGEGKGNVNYIDNRKKHAFKGDYVYYTDSAAIAYGGMPGPLMKEFSKGDTLYLHADTISMKAFELNTPKEYRKIFAIDNVRMYRSDFQAVCEFMVSNTKDSTLTMYEQPIIWSEMRQLKGDSIKAYMNDSTIREAFVFGNASSIEKLDEEEHYNQIFSKYMQAQFDNGNIRRVEVVGNVLLAFYPYDEKSKALTMLNYTETDTMRVHIDSERKLEKVWTSKAQGTAYPLTQVPSDKLKLEGFQWLEGLRPRDKYDVFRRTKER